MHKLWNQECKEKAKAYRQARKQGSAISEKHALRNTTRAAKRLYWMRQIQDASNPKDIYRITGWHKNKGLSTSPPLRYEDKIYTDASSKAEALWHALLERRTSEEDICIFLEQSASQPKVDVQERVDLTESEHCLLLSNNNAP